MISPLLIFNNFDYSFNMVCVYVQAGLCHDACGIRGQLVRTSSLLLPRGCVCVCMLVCESQQDWKLVLSTAMCQPWLYAPLGLPSSENTQQGYCI